MVHEMLPNGLIAGESFIWLVLNYLVIETAINNVSSERIKLNYWDDEKPRSLIGLLETTVQSETSINDTKGAKNISKISASIQDGF